MYGPGRKKNNNTGCATGALNWTPPFYSTVSSCQMTDTKPLTFENILLLDVTHDCILTIIRRNSASLDFIFD